MSVPFYIAMIKVNEIYTNRRPETCAGCPLAAGFRTECGKQSTIRTSSSVQKIMVPDGRCKLRRGYRRG